MFKSVQIRILAFLILSLLYGAVSAEFWAPVREQNYNDIVYLSGGIGDTERDYLESKEVREKFNLEVLTASKSGSFVSMARVRVMTSTEMTIFDVVMDGPVLMASLPAAKYRVEVIVDGESQVRDVNLGKSRRQRVVTHWDVAAERLEKPEVSPAGVHPVVPRTIDGVEVVTVPGAEVERVDNGHYTKNDSERQQLLEQVRMLRAEAAHLENRARELEESLR